MIGKIYLPTIHLFAYSRNPHYDYSLREGKKTNYHWLWEKCNQIVNKKLLYEFDLRNFLQKEIPRIPAQNLIHQELSETEIPEYIDFNIGKHIDSYYIDDYFPLSIQKENHIQAEIYPLKLYDSYALGLNFYPKAELRNNKFNLDEIKEYGLNPSNCLVLSQANNSPLLGQTILITAKITGKNKNKSSEWLKNNIADQYIKALFPENEGNYFRKPAFNRAGKLFGKPVFEYGISRQLENYVHVLVWLIDDRDEKHIVDRSYNKLLDLFFFRAKVINAYKQTRKHSIKAKNRNLKIEDKLEEMVIDSSKTKALHHLNLTVIYKELVELNRMSVRYAKMLRDIEEHQNTIVDNTRNYTDKIREIKSVFPNESLGFLGFFGERICRSFQDQVAAELGYFQHGIDLVDNVADALRGQVAIEQANRERELQSTILGIGLGMTVAGNFASSYEAGSIAENGVSGFDFVHFIISFAISMLVGLIVWKLASMYFRSRYEKKQLIRQNNQSSRFIFWQNKREQ